jgi:hypothetical protein
MKKITIVYANGIKFFKGRNGKLYISREGAIKSLKEWTRKQYRAYVLGA